MARFYQLTDLDSIPTRGARGRAGQLLQTVKRGGDPQPYRASTWLACSSAATGQAIAGARHPRRRFAAEIPWLRAYASKTTLRRWASSALALLP
jgi:hypothetical protein